LCIIDNGNNGNDDGDIFMFIIVRVIDEKTFSLDCEI